MSRFASVSVLALCMANPGFAQELNALVWCDHTDPALIEPFEKANNVKVNLKEYEGTGAGLSIVEQSRPGDWDVFVIDGVDVPRAVEMDLLAEIPADKLPMADIFPEVRMEANNTKDGKIYAVTEKFGYNTVSFNKSKVSAADMADMTKLWSGAFKGQLAVYDYYLPVLGLVALGQGINTADINAESLPKLKDPLMALRKASKQVSDVVSAQTALATGEVDIVVGGGEWLTAVLAAVFPNRRGWPSVPAR